MDLWRSYVEQPPGFEDKGFPDHVYKLNKALYNLKQDPRAYYERLSKFLLIVTSTLAKWTLLFYWEKKILLLIQIFVDDFIFAAKSENLLWGIAKLMKEDFKKRMMGGLTFFLWLSI